jgi:hypothetical protein
MTGMGQIADCQLLITHHHIAAGIAMSGRRPLIKGLCEVF